MKKKEKRKCKKKKMIPAPDDEAILFELFRIPLG